MHPHPYEILSQLLAGVSTVPNSFDEEVFKMMLEYNDRPIVLPLSNPTSKSECTFEEAYRCDHGVQV